MVKNHFRFSELVRSTLSHVCWLYALFLSFIPLNAIDYTVPYYPWKIDTCDINNDGRQDLIVLTSEGLCALLNNGDGNFAPYELIIPGDVKIIACCQLDNIAGDDIVVLRCYSGDEPLQYEYYYNGNFSDTIVIPFIGDMTLHYSFKYAHGDFNNDGWEDIVLTGFVDHPSNQIYWCYMYNLGNHQFSAPVWVQCLFDAYSALAVGDFNEDNMDDIAFTISSIQVYYSTGNGFNNYEALPAYHCGGIVAVDFDQDGDMDIVTNAWEGGAINHHYYLENVPGNAFVIHDHYYEHYMGTIHSADLNSDAYPDIVCTPGGSTLGVFINLQNWTMELNSVTFPFYGENWQYSCLDRFDDNASYDIAIARDTAAENNLTILYNDGDGNFTQTSVLNQDDVIPSVSSTIICYPNPCKDFVCFKTNSPEPSSSYTIYNTRGQIIRQFVSQGREFGWDLTDSNGLKVSSGIYLIRKDIDFKNHISKFIILK